MLSNNYPIKNYEDFKELFVREDGRRKNAVLLAWYKNRSMMSWIRSRVSSDRYDRRYAKGFRIHDMSELKDYVMWLIRAHIKYSMSEMMTDSIWIPEWGWYGSHLYRTDRNGLCFDRDYRSYRYVRKDNGRDFKMKMGRLFNHIIDCTTVAEILPNPVRLWICEEVQRDWEMYTRVTMPPTDGCKLVVDDDFERIYSGRYLVGDFGSCMTNRGHHYFYENSVMAKAARIEREDGMILARCIIFTEVRDDDTGEILRLAERQYSSEGKEAFKYDLIRMLKDGGHIDGYKKVGAGCGEANAFLDLNGNSMSERRLSIKCTASGDDTISYQDSFKMYDMRKSRAYNYDASGWEYELDTTSEYLDPGSYDEYHDEYTHNDLQEVYYGRWMMCDEDRLDDFIYIEGEGYIHTDYCGYCENCDTYFREGCGEYSSITGEDYCCEDCREEAEREYKETHWTYSEYDDEYFEDDDDVTTLKRGACDEMSISRDSVERLVERGEAICINGKYYDAEWAEEVLDEA